MQVIFSKLHRRLEQIRNPGAVYHRHQASWVYLLTERTPCSRFPEIKYPSIYTEKYEANILAVALKAGFNSHSVLYTAFRKHTVVTPASFRKLSRH